MDIIFELIDKTERKIHLSKERWGHINQEHPEVSSYLEEITEALKTPLKITTYAIDENVKYYYKQIKRNPVKYILVIVKYLNNHGFVITSYIVRNVK